MPVAGNVGLTFLLKLGEQLAAVTEAIFLAFFLWWAHEKSDPASASRVARAKAFRHDKLASRQWLWGLSRRCCATVHASIVLLFRVVYYPAAAFRHGYDLSFKPSQPRRWVAVVISAGSAGHL